MNHKVYETNIDAWGDGYVKPPTRVCILVSNLKTKLI